MFIAVIYIMTTFMGNWILYNLESGIILYIIVTVP